MAISSSNPSPAPNRSGHKVLLICVLLVAAMVAAAVFSIYLGVHILSHAVFVHTTQGAHGSRQMAISTPIGSVRLSHGTVADAGMIGLPVYPGAKRLKDEEGDSFAAQFGSHGQMGVMAAKFETPDPIDKVAKFYRRSLTGQVTRVVQRDSQGKTLFEIKTADSDKIVTLKESGEGTRIALVKVFHGNNSAN
jgi:hypothetical protein